MKHFLLAAFLLLFINVWGQNKIAVDFRKAVLSDTFYTQDYTDKTSHSSDLNLLWTTTNNQYIVGYIGKNYQRIRIKFLSVTKDSANPKLYHVVGKSMVKNIVCTFRGTLAITLIKRYIGVDGCEDDSSSLPQKEEYCIIGNYHFEENRNLPNTGIFEGIFASKLFLDKNGSPLYNADTLDICSDGYGNNQFAGTWTSFSSKAQKVCMWGDFRVPFPDDLDVGAGEFSPNPKYLQYGWQTYSDAYDGETPNAKALKAEEAEWWK